MSDRPLRDAAPRAPLVTQSGESLTGGGVAIVIPALNEVGDIEALLDDCAAQDPPADEVIVVDAGSADGTLEALRRREREWPELVVLEEAGAAPGRGRNVGVEHARYPVIATIDAGCRFEPGWLAALSAPVLGGVGSRAALGVARPEATSRFERAAGWFTLQAYKPSDRKPLVASEFLPAGRNGVCFPRRAWERVRGYPDELRWGEDKVFLNRLRSAGLELIVVPEAVVRWRPRSSLRELFRQYERYGRGDAIAGLDRQNELITLALYLCGGFLAAGAVAGRRGALALLLACVCAYLALFVAAARRELGWTRDLGWIPPIRLAADVAKMRGFLAIVLRQRHLAAPWRPPRAWRAGRWARSPARRSTRPRRRGGPE